LTVSGCQKGNPRSGSALECGDNPDSSGDTALDGAIIQSAVVVPTGRNSAGALQNYSVARFAGSTDLKWGMVTQGSQSLALGSTTSAASQLVE